MWKNADAIKRRCRKIKKDKNETLPCLHEGGVTRGDRSPKPAFRSFAYISIFVSFGTLCVLPVKHINRQIKFCYMNHCPVQSMMSGMYEKERTWWSLGSCCSSCDHLQNTRKLTRRQKVGLLILRRSEWTINANIILIVLEFQTRDDVRKQIAVTGTCGTDFQNVYQSRHDIKSSSACSML